MDARWDTEDKGVVRLEVDALRVDAILEVDVADVSPDMRVLPKTGGEPERPLERLTTGSDWVGDEKNELRRDVDGVSVSVSRLRASRTQHRRSRMQPRSRRHTGG